MNDAHKLKVSALAHEKCDNAILVTGLARSGTTMLGKIIHSLQNIEYKFEPALIRPLSLLINKMDKQDWCLLYEAYLYEEFFINAISGREINCNLKDGSSIYNVKPEKEIRIRLSQTLPKVEAERKAFNSTIAFKIPSPIDLVTLKTYYPKTRIVAIQRDLTDVFCSLIAKSWFKEDDLNATNRIWPTVKHGKHRIPFFVKTEDYDQWADMDELNRTAYYCIKCFESLNSLPSHLPIKYEELIARPKETVVLLAKSLGLEWGDKTDDIVSTIRKVNTKKDRDILKRLPVETRELLDKFSAAS